MSSLRGNTKPDQNQIFRFDKIDIFKSLDTLWKYNWDQLNKSEDNDLTWLITTDVQRHWLKDFIKKVEEIKHPSSAQLEEINKAKAFFDELLETFFILMDEWAHLTHDASNSKELCAILRKVLVSRAKVIDGDLSEQNWVNKYERMIDDMTGQVTKYNATKERIDLQIILKTVIDPKKTTVVEYHYYCEAAIEMNRKTPDVNG